MSSTAIIYRFFKHFLHNVIKYNTFFSMFVLKCLTDHFNLRLLMTAIKNMIDANINLPQSCLSCSILRKSAGHLLFVSRNAVRFVSFSLSAYRNDCVNVSYSMLAHCVQASSDAINKSAHC